MAYPKGIYVGDKAFRFRNGSITKNCLTCGIKFTSFLNQKRKFCSRPCFRKSRRISETGQCAKCGKTFEQRLPSGNVYRRRFCSLSCAASFTQTGRKHPPQPLEWRKKISEAQKGERGNNWKGGQYAKDELLRHSLDYKEWRRHVFQRDDYTCQSCGERGGELQADHEFPFALYPDLRFEILNGRTLCVPCHKKTPTYGGRTRAVQAVSPQVEPHVENFGLGVC